MKYVLSSLLCLFAYSAQAETLNEMIATWSQDDQNLANACDFIGSQTARGAAWAMNRSVRPGVALLTNVLGEKDSKNTMVGIFSVTLTEEGLMRQETVSVLCYRCANGHYDVSLARSGAETCGDKGFNQ